jgi:hypothetical protein
VIFENAETIEILQNADFVRGASVNIETKQGLYQVAPRVERATPARPALGLDRPNGTTVAECSSGVSGVIWW